MPKPNELPDGFPGAEETVLRAGRLFQTIDYDVDRIPASWDLEITHISHGVEKIDYDAQRILALILLWYSPGAWGHARFQGSALDLGRKLIMNRFKMGDKVVDKVLRRMEHDHGVIVRHSGGLGENRGGFLQIAPVMDRVEQITYPVTMSPATGELVACSAGGPVSGGPYLIPTVRHSEIAPTGLVSREDEDFVHVLTLRKHADAPTLDVDALSNERSAGRLPAAEGVATVAASTRDDGDPGALWLDDSGYPDQPDEPLTLAPATARPDARSLDGDHNETETRSETTDRLTSVRSSVNSADGDDALADGQTSGRPPAANVLAPGDPVHRYHREASIGRMLDLFRQQHEGELHRATDDKAKRSVVRRALRDATDLLRGDAGTEKLASQLRNAEARLHRAGATNPTLDLLGVAVLGCGRVVGTTEARAALVAALLDAVARRTTLAGEVMPPDDVEVQIALQRALLHRLDSDNLKRAVRQVCALRDEPLTYAFVNALVRRYATNGVPFNAALFAGAMAAAVWDHVTPTAEQLLDVCRREALRYPDLRVTPGDHVLIRDRDEAGASHSAVLRLGRGYRSDNGFGQQWAQVMRVARGEATCDDGSVVDIDTAVVDDSQDERVAWLASKTRPRS